MNPRVPPADPLRWQPSFQEYEVFGIFRINGTGKNSVPLPNDSVKALKHLSGLNKTSFLIWR